MGVMADDAAEVRRVGRVGIADARAALAATRALPDPFGEIRAEAARVDTAARLLRRLREIAVFDADWGGWGERPPCRQAVAVAAWTVRRLRDTHGAVMPARVMPLADGGVVVEWAPPHSRLEAEAAGSGQLRVAGTDGHDTEFGGDEEAFLEAVAVAAVTLAAASVSLSSEGVCQA